MKVRQLGKCQELEKCLECSRKKTSNAMMKLALMRTATEKEENSENKEKPLNQ
jgi:hypothetical protein